MAKHEDIKSIFKPREIFIMQSALHELKEKRENQYKSALTDRFKASGSLSTLYKPEDFAIDQIDKLILLFQGHEN